MKPIYDIEALVQPIPGDTPGGVSLLHDPAFDAIKAARREDDPALPAGIWQTALKVADWAEVETGCRTLLAERSKDLTLAAWLGESWLHRYGCGALPACFELLSELCTRHWDSLHPLPRDGDYGFRAAPLVWISQNYPTLLAGRIALCAGPDGSALTLARWLATQREAVAVKDRKDVPAARREEAARAAMALVQAVLAATPAALHAQLQAVGAAREPIARLDAWCTPRLGAEAPGFAPLLETIERIEGVLREWLALHPDWKEEAMVEVAPIQELPVVGMPESRPVERIDRLQSREEAYRLLAIVADYLMRYEPHSPVPYMLKRALDWGAKPLPALLVELTTGERGRMLGSALGLLPEVEDTK
ncbi:type VI secretion system protein TssA [Paraburkholderia acidipaludis]|uniref:type VI secretion system protein TssA n=1 Tax=Paraburkholderia acidipaludis TaxID=660537 RepID=UPI000487EAB7|nr:type VI secretion system protein TssA [Paraburkholderia acidipaludis]